jgi:O-antigen/teichoic acid export membrane protein
VIGAGSAAENNNLSKKVTNMMTQPAKRRFVILGLLANHNLLGIFDQGIVGVTGFVTVVLLGRAVAAEELGIYSLALSVVLFVKMVQETTLTGPYTVFCHRMQDERLHVYSGNSLVQGLLLSAVSMLGLAAFSIYLLATSDPEGLSPTFSVLTLIFSAILLREFIRRVTFAHLQVNQVVLMDTVVAFTQVAGLLLMMHIAMLTPATAFLVTGAACLAGMLIWRSASSERFSLTRVHFKSDLLMNWNFGRWALGGQGIGTAMFYAMPWLVTLYHGTAAAGLLAACNSIVGLVNILLLGLGNVLTPKAAKGYADGGHKELWRVLWRFLGLFALSIGVFMIVLLLWGNLIADILFDGRFPGAGPVICVLAFNVLATSLVMVAGNGLWAINRPSANFFAEVTRLLVTLVLVLFLVPELEVLGSAYALLVGSLSGGMISFLILWRLTRNKAA